VSFLTRKELRMTHDTRQDIEERAILISGLTSKTKDNKDSMLRELARLADTAGVAVVDTLTQNKDHIDSKWFLGKGKINELKEMCETLNCNVAIFNHELSGSQVRNLEQFLDVKIIDRTQLILDIFAGRAKTREGQLQVELAQLSYLLPRMHGQGKNLSRLGGGIGTRGPGESQLEVDRRHIRGRISELKRQLSEVSRHRTLHREKRRRVGVYQVSLVGYTNAGKSTLLKSLTGSDVFAEDKLFATLDPTSRQLLLPNGRTVVLTDTVGFIQDLPHDLVAAFRSTLEEVTEASLLLHVVDASDPDFDNQLRVVNEVLEELDSHGKDTIIIFNKIDQVSDEQREQLRLINNAICMSALDENDLLTLKLEIEKHLLNKSVQFRIPTEDGKAIALAYRMGEVLAQQLDEENGVMDMTIRLQDEDYAKHGYLLKGFEV
jgi:GTP-binding protein HflX